MERLNSCEVEHLLPARHAGGREQGARRDCAGSREEPALPDPAIPQQPASRSTTEHDGMRDSSAFAGR
jgi:hypothetical protein